MPLKQPIWDATAKNTIKQWTGMELQPTSMYGIRVYTEGKPKTNYVYYSPLQSLSHFLAPFQVPSFLRMLTGCPL